MKTKKLLFALLVLFAIFGSTNAQGQGIEGNFSVDPNPVTIEAGGTGKVTLNLSNYSVFTGYEFRLVLPTGITLKKAVENEDAYPLVWNDDKEKNEITHSMQRESQSDGSYKFICISTKTTDPFVATKMLTLTLEASSDATGTLTGKISEIAISTSNGEGITPADVTFTISIPGKPTVTADDKSREYGDANPDFTYTVSEGTIDGLVLTTDATETSGVGTYTITVPTSDDYNAVNGTLTVTKAPLTISGGTYTITQGEALPTFAAEYSGFKNGETSSVLTSQPTLTLEEGVTGSSAPGNYTITVTGGEADNYEITRTNGTLTINAPPVTVTANSYTITYGDALPDFSYSTEGGDLSGEPSISCEATATSGAGTYDINIATGTVTNDNVTYVKGTLTINKATLTATAKSYSRMQGEANPTFEIEYSGWKNNDDVSVLTTVPTATTTADASSAPGTYDITVSGGEAANYDFNYVNGTLTVTETPITVTATSYTITYGDALPEFAYTTEGGDLTGTPEITCEATATSGAGTYDINIAAGTVTNGNVTYVKGTLTINKATLTATAKSYSRKQGEANPTFEIEYSGWKNNEDVSVLTTVPTATTTADASSAPGTYDITVSGGEAANYDFNYVKGTLTVTYGSVTVTATSYTITYGDALPEFAYTTEGDDLTGTPEITCEATATSGAGTYDITISKGTVTNDNVSYVKGTLTINKATLTATAKSYSRKRGEANPTFEIEYSGWKNNEDVSVLTTVPTATTTADENSAAGTYDITVSGGEAANYDFNYVKGTLTVEPDITIVTARSYTITYGDALPEFGYDSNGEALNGRPEITCEASETAGAGTYPILISRGSITDSNVEFVNGTLTINKATLTATAVSCSREQGEANPEFEIEYSGWKYYDNLSVVTTVPTAYTTADESSEPGDYEIYVSGGEAANYEFEYVYGTLTVTEPAVIVTARSYTITYGDALPNFGYDLSDTDLEGTPEITCEATETSGVGTYDILISKGTITDSNVEFVMGTLTINKAPLTIKAEDKSKTYGDENPELTCTYSGFVKNETSAVLTTQPTIATTATVASGVGSYDITVSGAKAANYEITETKGTLTVTKATLTAKAKSYSRKQGEANPTFEIEYSGWKNNDDVSVLTTVPTATTTADATSVPGTYDITVSGGAAANYEFSYVKGTLTVTNGSFTLTYMVDGEIYKSVGYDYGATITPEAEPTKEGYTFSGWSEIPETMPAKDVTVTGSFTVNKYKLIYMVDGKEYKTYEVEYGTSITPEADPTKDGYKFSGWSEIPETMPAKDVTVSGTFSIGTYTLTYMVDGKEYKTVSYEYGATITAEAEPTKEGYTFSGWSEIPTTMPGNDVTVTGSFTVNKYKLTYVVDGEEYKSLEVEYGAKITPEAEPTKEGYVFSGWSNLPSTMPAHDVEVTGTFTSLVFTVDDVTYEITGDGTVTINDCDQKGEVTIESTVEINGQTYLVTAIANGAFKDNKDITSLTIADGITIIGDNAFEGCSKLVVINIGKDVLIIGYKAFANIGTESSSARRRSAGSVVIVNCYAESVPFTASDAFENTPIENGTLYVKDNLVDEFKATSPWSSFGKIIGFSEASAINSISIDSTDAHIYDIHGNRLDDVRKGVNIIRTRDGKTKKVLVK